MSRKTSNGRHAGPPRAPESVLSVFRVAPEIHRVQLAGRFQGAWADLLLNPPSETVDILDDLMARAQANGDRMAAVDRRELRAILARVLVAWNLVDAHGAPVPPTPEGIAATQYPLLMELFLAWIRVPALPPTHAADSTNGSGDSAAAPPSASSIPSIAASST
jgi:hypothetical protein